jgi:GTP-binding protein
VILVVNKVDRPDARIAEVVDEVYELFMDLDADDDNARQIDFPIVYASAKAGRASLTKPRDGERPTGEDLKPLFD